MLEKINFFIDNWYVIVTFVCVIILAITKIVQFIGYPTEKKLEEVKKRLLTYVTEAELALGGETGQLKLVMVYDYFCDAFPYLKKWISFDKFSDMVDEILPTMRNVLDKKDNEDVSL